MPIDKDSSDRWFTHFVKNWQAYFYAETPDYPGQLVSPSKKRRLWTPNDGVFVPKYSSVAESARREENPM